MAKCHRNDVGSLMLDRPATSPGNSGGHFRLWTAFSGSPFRCKIFDVVSCGGSFCYHHHHKDVAAPATDSTDNTAKSSSKIDIEKPLEKPKTNKSKAKSEKLSDLIKLGGLVGE